MKSNYDVLVIGGGPAGALAAKTAAEKGLSACLVEKRPAIGAPVRCAEGIGKEALAEFVKPDPRWISAEMTGAGIVAPDGFEMTLESSMAGGKSGISSTARCLTAHWSGRRQKPGQTSLSRPAHPRR